MKEGKKEGNWIEPIEFEGWTGVGHPPRMGKNIPVEKQKHKRPGETMRPGHIYHNKTPCHLCSISKVTWFLLPPALWRGQGHRRGVSSRIIKVSATLQVPQALQAGGHTLISSAWSSGLVSTPAKLTELTWDLGGSSRVIQGPTSCGRLPLGHLWPLPFQCNRIHIWRVPWEHPSPCAAGPKGTRCLSQVRYSACPTSTQPGLHNPNVQGSGIYPRCEGNPS